VFGHSVKAQGIEAGELSTIIIESSSSPHGKFPSTAEIPFKLSELPAFCR
jgi:hypothetical protein